MKVWQRSGLCIGEELKVPKDLFVEPDKAIARLISINYIGDTDAGIIIDFTFKPAFGTINPNGYHYKMMISWSSIWCGHVKIYRMNGDMIHAKRMREVIV